MDVFSAINCRENLDPIDLALIVAETTMDIEVDTAIKDYFYESGLSSCEADNIFMEASEEEKSDNIFKKAVEAIIAAISNFIDGVISAIQNLFDGRENLTPEEYKASNAMKIRLNKDIMKLTDEIDNEILKGRKIIQKISSATGISDKVIAGFCDDSAELLEAIGPVAVTAGVAFGFEKVIRKKLKEKQKEIKSLEAEAKKIKGEKKEKRRSQSLRVLNRLKSDISYYASEVKSYVKECDRIYRKEIKSKN